MIFLAGKVILLLHYDYFKILRSIAMEVEMEDQTTLPEHLCGQCHLPRVPPDLFIERKPSAIPSYRDIGR